MKIIRHLAPTLTFEQFVERHQLWVEIFPSGHWRKAVLGGATSPYGILPYSAHGATEEKAIQALAEAVSGLTLHKSNGQVIYVPVFNPRSFW